MSNLQDITSSDDWKQEDWLKFVQQRLTDMRNKRSKYETMWDLFDAQVEAKSFYDNFGQLQVNEALEKALIEQYMGRTDGKTNFDILPDGQTDIEQLQPTKYAMKFFMDGNGKDNFWRENNYLRGIKSHYGSGIFYTGIRSYKDIRYSVKEDAEEGMFKESNYDKHEHETWFFFPKALHVRDFYFDDEAYGQSDVQQGADCIMKEKISKSDFYSRYKDNKNYNQEAVKNTREGIDINKKNLEDTGTNSIILYHYFHRVTKKYIILANEKEVIYEGIFLYDDGKLPFVNVQHYTNINRFWGEGIPERCQWMKAYKSEIWQDILAGAEMNSGINLLTGNDDEIGQDWSVGGRGVNIWRTTGGAERVQQINTTPNLNYMQSVLGLLDQQITVSTGQNPLEQFDPGTDKVGIKEIMEASKAVRNKSIDMNYNIGLDEALTMMLSRIKQFAPALLSESIKSKKGDIIKTIFPKISIKGYSVSRKKGQQVFTKDLGKYGYFELKPEIIEGVGVKVVTPSTYSTLPILERQKVMEYIDMMLKLSQAAALDQTGAMMQALVKEINFEELTKWTNDAFEFDANGLKANTKKDELREKVNEKLKRIEEAISLTQTNDVTQASQISAPRGATINEEETELAPAGLGVAPEQEQLAPGV